MPVKLNSSGGGSVTIDVPSTASAYTLTAPAANATLITTGSSGQIIPKAALPTGSVLQVVTNYMPSQNEGSYASAVDCFSCSITPTSASSKVLILVNMAGCGTRDTSTHASIWLARGSGRTVLTYFANYIGNVASSGEEGYPSTTYLDSPATTSQVDYYVRAIRSSGSASVYINHYAGGSANDRTLYAVSTITLMEIAA